MRFFVVDPQTGELVNDFGSGTTLVNPDLGQFSIQAFPGLANNPAFNGSVVFEFDGQTRIDNSGPFTLDASPANAIAPLQLAPGSYTLTATAFNQQDGAGDVVETSSVQFEVAGEPVTGEGGGSGSGGESAEKSEFEIQGEAEGEAETEAEAEVTLQVAGGATANSAVASAFGSNAATQTLSSGSISLALRDAAEIAEAQPITSEGPSGAGTRPIGGDNPLAGGDPPSTSIGIISAEAEAEAELESEAEAEAESGSASAVAGLSAAVAAVGTDVFLDSDGTSSAIATETVTSINGATSTNTSVSDIDGEVIFSATLPNPQDRGVPLAEDNATLQEEPPNAPNAETLQANSNGILQTNTEAEIEVETEAETEVAVADGTAAAAASGGSGVAVAGNFATADTETSIGTSTSTSRVTDSTPLFFDGVLSDRFGGSISLLTQDGQEATLINYENGAISDPLTQMDSPTVLATLEVLDVVPGTGLFEAESEAEAEAEVEVDVGNSAAAAAVVATGGAGSNALGATSLASASTAASTSTRDHQGELVRANDVVQIASYRSDNDQALTDELLSIRSGRSGDSADAPAAEAEAEAEASASVSIPEDGTPLINVVSDGDALGSAASASGVAIGGILTSRVAEVSTGVNQVAERSLEDDGETQLREVSGSSQPLVSQPGNLEIENEAEAEAEAEAEVGFNAAAAGAAAIAVQAANAFIPVTTEGASATSASTSVFSGGENRLVDSDRPGPEPLGDRGNIPLPAVDLNDIIFEVELETETEAEVGYKAGSAAASAAAAGYDGIKSDILVDATTNAAAAAAAAGAFTALIIDVPENGQAGEIFASARAWDPQGRGVAVSVTVAGLPLVGGADNELEREAEGRYEALVEIRILTDAFDPAEIGFLSNLVSIDTDDGEPEGPDSRFESEAEVEAEAAAEAGYGTAAAASSAAATGFAANAVADSITVTEDIDVNFGELVEGTDTSEKIDGTAGLDALSGAGGDDILNGLDSADRLAGGDGNDKLNGGNGNDGLFGGGDQDTLNGGAGRDYLSGGSGDDRLNGNQDNDVLEGDSGNDVLSGGAGDDSLFGGDDDDLLKGGTGEDLLRGGAGSDLIRGGDDSDVLFGEAGQDKLEGGAGDDRLEGGLGDDKLFGNDGDDSLLGGEGRDVFKGGSGADRFIFTESWGQDSINDFSAADGDTLDFVALGISQGDLIIQQRSNKTFVQYQENSVELIGVTETLNVRSFVFS